MKTLRPLLRLVRLAEGRPVDGIVIIRGLVPSCDLKAAKKIFDAVRQFEQTAKMYQQANKMSMT